MTPKQYFVVKIEFGIITLLSGNTEDENEVKVWYNTLSKEHKNCHICETIFG